MVQNKEIKKETPDNLKNGDAHEETLINGNNAEEQHYESEEDDYLDHLLIVPSLDKNVTTRNTNLISESLLSFYKAIETRKEYEKIKLELMGDLLPIKNEVDEKSCEHETYVNGGTSEPINGIIQHEKQNEVNDNIQWPIRKFTIHFPTAQFVPENPPKLFDQFEICRRCIIFFKSKKFRKMHNALNHRRKRNSTDLNSSLSDGELRNVRKRIRSGGKGKLLTCDLCSKTFKIKALIRSHMNCHTLEKPIHCNLCPYAAKRNYDMKQHHLVHHNPDRIKTKRTRRRKCDKCDEMLENKKAFRVHMRLNHRENITRKPRIYKKCEKCQEAIYTKKLYKIHMKQYHRHFLYIKCEKCNRRFKTNFRLKKHRSRFATLGQDCRLKVRNVGTFKCEVCSTKFPLKSHLALHMKKHHKCEHCDLIFNSQFSLKYHEFSHQDTEPKCSNCAKVFSSEQKFSNHLKKKVCMANGLTNGHIENGIII